MTGLLLLLAMAAAMVLFREALGRTVVEAIRDIDWKWVVILALLAFAVWGIVHHLQAPVNLTGDAIAGLFDTFTYGDLVIGVTVALLNRQTRRLLARLPGLARLAVHLAARAGRTRRAPAKPRRRAPDRDEPEPEAWIGALAFA